MRMLVIGATRLIGRELVPRLVAAWNEVLRTARSEREVAELQDLGASAAVSQLTVFPDHAEDLPERSSGNARIRRGVNHDSSAMRTRTTAVTVTAALLVGSLSGCSSSGQSDEAWSQVASAFEGADFAHPDLPLDELILDADITVIGEFGEVIGERALTGDYAYVQIELIVQDVIAGDVEAGDVLTFEGWTNEVTEVPQGEMLMFLEEKVSDVDPPGLWIWHTSRGIWTETERDEIDTPIAESPPVDSPLYSDEVDDLTSLADLVETVEAIARP